MAHAATAIQDTSPSYTARLSRYSIKSSNMDNNCDFGKPGFRNSNCLVFSQSTYLFSNKHVSTNSSLMLIWKGYKYFYGITWVVNALTHVSSNTDSWL